MLQGQEGLDIAVLFVVGENFVEAEAFLEQIKTIEFSLQLLKQLVRFCSCFRVFKGFNDCSAGLASFWKVTNGFTEERGESTGPSGCPPQSPGCALVFRNSHDSFLLVHLVSLKDNGIIFFPFQKLDREAMMLSHVPALTEDGEGLKMVRRGTSEQAEPFSEAFWKRQSYLTPCKTGGNFLKVFWQDSQTPSVFTGYK